MPITLHVVDAFTDQPFRGNPAAVCLLGQPADESWMKLVAREMNLSETAFLHPIEGGFSLRWLTPVVEVKLCGHATLAASFALWETGVLSPNQEARFHTLSGWLTCRRVGSWIEMSFPTVACDPCDPPAVLQEALNCDIVASGCTGMDFLIEVKDAPVLRRLKPNFGMLSSLPVRGVIATCRSDANSYDFLSRFFAPAAGVNEDPVTGSAHCTLGPYWQAKLGKSDFVAYQASERGGLVKLTVQPDRVLLYGQAVMMSKVELMH
jgi:PhzF family phenazine biosynthesis protein